MVDKVFLVGFKSALLLNDIEFFISQSGQIQTVVIEPDDFFLGKSDPSIPHMICVSKDMKLRKSIMERLTDSSYKRYTFIHDSSVQSKNLRIGQGCFISPMVTIASDAIVGDDCILSPYCMVSHRSHLGNGSIMQPYSILAGSSTTGQCCKLNVRSSIIDNISITDFVEIGAGSLVNKSIEHPGFYLGIPARKKIS